MLQERPDHASSQDEATVPVATTTVCEVCHVVMLQCIYVLNNYYNPHTVARRRFKTFNNFVDELKVGTVSIVFIVFSVLISINYTTV